MKKNVFTPQEVTYGSNKKAYFKCHICGYEWKTVISSRTSQKADCRMCKRRLNSSFPEQCIYHYIALYFPDAINGDKAVLNGREIDVYVPSLQFAIEYDGKAWHKNVNKDMSKDALCKEKGIILYRVREIGCQELDSNDSVTFEYTYGDYEALSQIIFEILIDIGVKNPEVDIIRDEHYIKEKYYSLLDNSLEKLYPDIAKEWCYKKNGRITPDLISPWTNDKYYWKCSVCEKIYLASPHNRVNRGSSCPDCGVKKQIKSQSFPVINLDTGEKFESINKAAAKYYLSRSGIGQCCRGRTKTCGGYRWQYDETQLSEAHLLAAKRRSFGNAKRQRRVLNIDTGDIYESLKDAQEKTHIHNISAVCNGVRLCAGGYHWKYVDEE